MKTSAILLALLTALPVFAGRIITYTAVSDKSQEEANNAAMAGVAKQIVVQVNSNQTLTKKEVKSKGNSTLDETFFSSNNVKSNLKLKGVKIETIKVSKGYKATASLDMDEFTADIQFQIRRIKTEVMKLENKARESLKNRLYAKAATDLQAAQDMLPEYERLLWQLSKVYPLNDSLRILHSLPEVETALINKLSQVKVTGPAEKFTLTTSEMPEWNVTVSDGEGPLPGFPIIVKQGRQTLSEKRTNDKGVATFLLRNVNYETGPYSMVVLPNLPLSIAKSCGLDRGIEITYDVKLSRCEIHDDVLQLRFLHLSVANGDARMRNQILNGLRDRINGFDTVAEHIDLPASGQFLLDGLPDQEGVFLHNVGLDRIPPFRRLFDGAHILHARQ